MGLKIDIIRILTSVLSAEMLSSYFTIKFIIIVLN